MTTVLSVLGALLLLCGIVGAHEFGHFIVARAVGIGVKEYAIGFGPKLFGWQGKKTRYSVRLLPLGGYCRFIGDDEDDADAPDAFNKQAVWRRFVTTLAGPVMNVVLAYVAVFVFLTCVGFQYTAPVIAQVDPAMNAAAAGMLPGDVITSVNGEAIAYDSSGAMRLRDIVGQSGAETPIDFTVSRDGVESQIAVTPTQTQSGYQIGIVMGVENYKYPVFSAVVPSFELIGQYMRVMIEALRNLFATGEGLEESVGPVGLVTIMSEEIQNGFETVLNLIVLISLNLGIMNLLPLPVLDGGNLVLLIVEGVRGKPLKERWEIAVRVTSAALLIGVMLLFTYRDIARIITGG